MSIRHLDSLLQPESVAVIGASDRPGSVGATVWRNLCAGGFEGALYAVNRRHDTVGGVTAWPSVAALPHGPDLALICIPPAGVAALIRQLGARGTRAAIVMTAGFSVAQKAAVLTAARKHTLRVLGPNCLGLLAPHHGLNASFSQVAAAPGTLAFVSQSGALATAMLDWAQPRGVGFSQVVSLGEHADVDFGDLLDYLGSDSRTQAILLYIESIEAPRKFMSAARAAARNKPVIVVKAGRSALGQMAAASHTGALAGSDIVFDAAIRRAGMLRVDTLQDLFTAAATLAHFRTPPTRGLSDEQRAALDRLTLVTNGGGAGVLAADAAAQAGVELAVLSTATLDALHAVLPANWSKGNPVDIIGDAPVERYVAALKVLQDDTGTGTVLFMHAPTAIVPSADIAAALLPLVQPAPGQLQRLLACWMGDPSVRDARSAFQRVGIPCYDTPEEAVRAFAMLRDYRQNQALLLEAPPATSTQAPLDLRPAKDLVAKVLAAGREWLTEPETKAVLQACAIPVLETLVTAATARAAVAAARRVGYPVALKILSPQITHKSDVGGVSLDIADDAALRAAAAAMLARVVLHQPDAEVTGFTVQRMVHRTRALELIVGAHVDPLFGPVILFGQGGTAVEVVADRAVALPPLNLPLARALVAGTRVARLLAGWRDVPAANMDAIIATLCNLSALLAEMPQIAELDINPLLADAQGVLALDARIRVSARAPGSGAAFAIRPYPVELVQTAAWRGDTVVLRPIRPEDEARHLEFLSRLDPTDIRMRVFYSRRSIERSELARLTQIDYEREMAFVATAPGPTGDEETLGVARAAIDPDNIGAEFGIVIRSDLKGTGLGRLLMDKLVGYLRERRTQCLHATVLRENTRMLSMMHAMGFVHDDDQPADDTVAVTLVLSGPAAQASKA